MISALDRTVPITVQCRTGPETRWFDRRSIIGYIGDADENGCREWMGYRLPSGYGHLRFVVGSRTDSRGRVRPKESGIMAHRAVYQVLVGQIPDNMALVHLCGKRACVATHHLKLCGRDVNPGGDLCLRGHTMVQRPGDNPPGRKRCQECHNKKKREKRVRACVERIKAAK